jgi:hypothetical protein
MIIMDDEFLARLGGEFNVDTTLPLRLQKRALLDSLGFASNPDLRTSRANDAAEVQRLYEMYRKIGRTFLIIVSEKPMRTVTPPLFIVRRDDDVLWRDDAGVRRELNASQTLAVIGQYPDSTWVEFSPLLWGEHALAGRLIYESPSFQLLEAQRGAVPAQLVNDRTLSTYVGALSFFDVDTTQYLMDCRRLRSKGFVRLCSKREIRRIGGAMPAPTVFEALRRFSRYPTLEFAYVNGRVLPIDIDWPAQYIRKERIG